MNKQIHIVSTLLFITVITACGPQPTQTPLQPVAPTEAPVQPTQTFRSTDTPLPTSTAVPATDTSTPIPVVSISFANDIMPIFSNNCNECHGIKQIKEGLDMTTYEALMAGSFNGTVITPGNAADSFLVQQIVEGEMPKRGPKLTAEQIQMVSDWINAGALNN